MANNYQNDLNNLNGVINNINSFKVDKIARKDQIASFDLIQNQSLRAYAIVLGYRALQSIESMFSRWMNYRYGEGDNMKIPDKSDCPDFSDIDFNPNGDI